jgi:hypothetical protein
VTKRRPRRHDELTELLAEPHDHGVGRKQWREGSPPDAGVEPERVSVRTP